MYACEARLDIPVRESSHLPPVAPETENDQSDLPSIEFTKEEFGVWYCHRIVRLEVIYSSLP